MDATQTASRPARRVPQARSIATRRRLLRAAIAALVSRGYAGTTTSSVARDAGVSQGALFKHFPSKLALYAAAAEDLFIDLVAQYRRAFEDAAAAPERERDPVGYGVTLLWRSFCAPELQAAFELYTAARTDPELREAVAPVLARHRDNLHDEARRLFPDFAERPDFERAIDALMDAMQGRVLGRAVLVEPGDDAAALDYYRDWMRRELAGSS